MKVWLITIGEPLPLDKENSRPLRTGLLAQELNRRGHHVTWWTSSINHSTKTQRANENKSVQWSDKLEIKLLYGCDYSKNVSLRRFVNHREIAQSFKAWAPKEPKPDIILASFPSIELCEAATRYAKSHNVPCLVDIRDLWPDVFYTLAPSPFRPLVKIPFYWLRKSTQRALSTADGLIGISDGYLDWGLNHAARAKNAGDQVLPLGYRPPERGQENLGESKLTNLLQQKIKPDDVVCWFIGTFGRTYHLSPVIEAAAKLRDEFPYIKFIFSGAGDNDDRWRQEAKELSNVVFTGWVDADQVSWLLSRSDIGLAAYSQSATQGLPNKIFEYLSAEIPILSSLRGETADLLSKYDCGITYQANSSTDLVEKIKQMLSPEKRARMGANGLRLFKSKFSSDIVYPKLAAHLESQA